MVFHAALVFVTPLLSYPLVTVFNMTELLLVLVVALLVAVVVVAVLMQRVVETTIRVADSKLGDATKAGSSELAMHNSVFSEQVGSMSGELDKVKVFMQTMERERANQHGQVVQHLQAAQSTTQQLSDSTQVLREALASPKARGQWGERMAEDVLQAAGFVDGVNYRTQRGIAGGTIPDFTFMLPRGLLMHMDVKFPFVNYMAYLDANSDTERDRASAEFVKDVRHHVKALTKRGYIDPPNTVAFVLMFIPNESVYAFLHDNDPQLLDVALGQRVILCSPSTLFAVLGVVRAATDAFVFERTSNEILECLGNFSKQWEAFGEALDKVERNFETARRSFDELTGPRRRMLERQIDRIDQLTIQSEQQPMLVDASAGEPIEISGGSA